ncbi:MAG: MerR family transcriptional regulator [Desulfuromonadaceae bacterium]|nr:MerR family transcriptional regulator [Desulfuromonadaceae bacterium]
MSLGITWYTLEEAEGKFGLNRADILKWAEDGLVRVEKADNKVIRVNVDDIELKVQELTGI